MDAWVYRLRDGYTAGYYRTESAEDAQTVFPWQNKTCRDCPFWSNGICRLYAEYRPGDAHTCSYFDPWNRDAGETVIRERQSKGPGQWWEWYNTRGATG
jgi:hypothetical protein